MPGTWATVRYDVANVGSGPLRVLGTCPSSTVVSTSQEPFTGRPAGAHDRSPGGDGGLARAAAGLSGAEPPCHEGGGLTSTAVRPPELGHVSHKLAPKSIGDASRLRAAPQRSRTRRRRGLACRPRRCYPSGASTPAAASTADAPSARHGSRPTRSRAHESAAPDGTHGRRLSRDETNLVVGFIEASGDRRVSRQASRRPEVPGSAGCRRRAAASSPGRKRRGLQARAVLRTRLARRTA